MINWTYAKLTGRSTEWRSTRKKHLESEGNGVCAACSREKGLEVHHIIPFDVRPELELASENLITLCSWCHFVFGHYCDYRSFNPSVVDDVRWYRIKRLGFRKKII